MHDKPAPRPDGGIPLRSDGGADVRYIRWELCTACFLPNHVSATKRMHAEKIPISKITQPFGQRSLPIPQYLVHCRRKVLLGTSIPATKIRRKARGIKNIRVHTTPLVCCRMACATEAPRLLHDRCGMSLLIPGTSGLEYDAPAGTGSPTCGRNPRSASIRFCRSNVQRMALAAVKSSRPLGVQVPSPVEIPHTSADFGKWAVTSCRFIFGSTSLVPFWSPQSVITLVQTVPLRASQKAVPTQTTKAPDDLALPREVSMTAMDLVASIVTKALGLPSKGPSPFENPEVWPCVQPGCNFYTYSARSAQHRQVWVQSIPSAQKRTNISRRQSLRPIIHNGRLQNCKTSLQHARCSLCARLGKQVPERDIESSGAHLAPSLPRRIGHEKRKCQQTSRDFGTRLRPTPFASEWGTTKKLEFARKEGTDYDSVVGFESLSRRLVD